jgi:hypothetical protein
MVVHTMGCAKRARRKAYSMLHRNMRHEYLYMCNPKGLILGITGIKHQYGLQALCAMCLKKYYVWHL